MAVSPTICAIVTDPDEEVDCFIDKIRLSSGNLTTPCGCDYHLYLNDGETLEYADNDHAMQVKSGLVRSSYLIPVVLEGTKNGILQERIIKCNCNGLSLTDSMITLLSGIHIETEDVDSHPFGKIKQLISKEKLGEAMSLLNKCDAENSIVSYLKSKCVEDDKSKTAYLFIALSTGDDVMKRMILSSMSQKLLEHRNAAWDVVKTIDCLNKSYKHGDIYSLDSDSQHDHVEHILSYYKGDIDRGRKSTDRLILGNSVPGMLKHIAVNNQKFYAEKIRSTVIAIEPECDKFYVETNPSIVRRQNGYTILCRTVNYDYKNKQWVPRDGGKIIRTRNLLLDIDDDFNIVKQRRIELHPNLQYQRERVHPWIKGHEDCRLFLRGDELWYTYTSLDTNPLGYHQISMCKLNDDAQVVQLVPLLRHNNTTQKNWLSFAIDDQIYCVYSYSPLTILKVDQNTGECGALDGFRGLQSKIFRGSTGPIPYESPSGVKGWLLMVHNTSVDRVYLQRWVWLDENFVMKAASSAFYFTKIGVEFPVGMCESHTKNEIIVTFGIEDKQGAACRIKYDTINKYLWENGTKL
uniref:Uncharacterized protein n=1 Tax=Pithovirus LCPAC404 TaxID=2506597 RepID=A0A481ZE78_9VIRU|nr:MAG: uncharacterized protein LCPAC404_00230 [Pithovirus LCPAC404]